MKRLLIFILFGLSLNLSAQQVLKRNMLIADTLQLKSLTANTATPASTWSNVYAKNDSLYFINDNGAVWNVVAWRDSISIHRDLLNYLNSMFRKDADSTLSAKYPLNISALRLEPDSRYIPFNVPNYQSAYGDTLSIGAVISGHKAFEVYAISDGAQRYTETGIKADNIHDVYWDYAWGWGADTKDPTGFVTDTTSHISFTNHNRTFIISGNYRIYYDGHPYDLTGDTVQISDVMGLHYIYYDSTALTETTIFPGIDQALVSFIYWNSTTKKGLMNEERHGCDMDWKTHEYLHETRGAAYYTGMNGTFGNATFSISSGEWYDEDIEHDTPTLTTATILYKNGDANFQWDTLQTAYYKTNGGNIRYNNGNALADVGANAYVAYWIFVTSDSARPYVSLMGQRTDANIANARANNTYSSLSLGSLPFVEMKLLYRVILRNDATPYEETLDFRTTSAIGTTYVATDHGTLTGLLDDDHTQYGLKAGTLAQFAATTSVELAGVISDETGTGVAVFGTSPTISGHPTVEGVTSTGATGTGKFVFDTSPTLVTPLLGTPTSGNFSTGTFTWPTFNQNTTGSAAKWTTARTLAGNSVDGSANVAFANKFIVQGTTDAGLSGAQFLGALGTGLVKNTTTTGVLSIATAGVDYQSALTAGQLANINAGAVFTKSADSTISALYPVRMSALDLLPDSRYTLGNLPVYSALYGDTVDLNFTIAGKRPLQLYGVADGTGSVADWGLNAVKGKFAGNLTLGSTITIGGVTYTYPASAGTNNYVLTTDGSGTLSWTDKTGGTAGYINSLNSSSVAAQTLVGTSPISVSTVTATGVHTIAMTQAATGANGWLSSTDWNTFNGKQAAGTYVTAVTGTAPVVSSGGTTPAISMASASASANGYLSSTDWSTFNAKEPAVTKGNLTEATSSVLTITGGTSAVIGSGTSLQVKQASASQGGYLSASDWSMFNTKGNYFQLDSDTTLSALFPVNISSLKYEPDSRFVDNLPIWNSLYGETISRGIVIGGTKVFDAWGYSDGAQSTYQTGVTVAGTLFTDSIKLDWESGTGGMVRQNDATMSRLMLGAGRAASPGAPLKFTDGVNLTDTEHGAMEFDGTLLTFTPGANGSARKTFAFTSDLAGYATTTLNNLGTTAINASLLPGTSGAVSLGSTSKMWGDLFLKSGSVINWDNGDATLTHSANKLTLSGAYLGIGADPGSIPLVVAGAGKLNNQLYVFSTESGKEEHRIELNTMDADVMRIYGYDLTGSSYKPLFIGGLAGATSGLKIDGDATFLNLTSTGAVLTGNLTPTTTNIYSLGTTSKRWSEVFASNFVSTTYFQGAYVALIEQSSAPSVAGGNGNVYAKDDNKLYFKNDVGDEYDLTAGGVFTAKVSLTNAQVLALDTTPLEIIANPGAGKAIWVDAAQSFIRVNYATSQFNCAGGINLYYNGGSMATGYQIASPPISVTSTMIMGLYTNTLGVENIALANVSMLIGLPTSVSSGGGTIDVYLVYRIVTL